MGTGLRGLAGSLMLIAALASGPATAAQKMVSESGQWRGIVADEAGRRSCFAAASPQSRLPSDLKRDPGFLFVTLRGRTPAAGVEFSARLGFPLAETGNLLRIDGADFRLLARGELAWLAEPTDEARVYARLRAAREARLEVRSARGNTTTDVYDLTGLSAAVDQLGEKCGR